MEEHLAEKSTPGGAAPLEKLPGHWLLAGLGKRILRPGGLELTQRMLASLAIGRTDDVVEFAPGLGVTTRLTLARSPSSYTAVERDAAAARTVQHYLRGAHERCVLGHAEQTNLPDAQATVVYGEAMLSMQMSSTRVRIVREAYRLLRPQGRYGIHELCLVPDDISSDLKERIQTELSDQIRANVRPLTRAEWRSLLEAEGFAVIAEERAPMHLLEPWRVVQDEGLLGAVRFAWNVARRSAARRRVLAMRRIFRRYREHLAAIMLIGHKT